MRFRLSLAWCRFYFISPPKNSKFICDVLKKHVHRLSFSFVLCFNLNRVECCLWSSVCWLKVPSSTKAFCFCAAFSLVWTIISAFGAHFVKLVSIYTLDKVRQNEVSVQKRHVGCVFACASRHLLERWQPLKTSVQRLAPSQQLSQDDVTVKWEKLSGRSVNTSCHTTVVGFENLKKKTKLNTEAHKSTTCFGLEHEATDSGVITPMKVRVACRQTE